MRQAAGLTQQELAGRAGISRAYLAALERGLSSATKAPPNPSRKLLHAIATGLSLTLEGLFEGPEPSGASGLVVFGDPAGASFVLPSNDGVVVVDEGIDPALGLCAKDVVLVRRLLPAESVPEGLCLFETPRGVRWGRVAHIGQQPYIEGIDKSFRPLGKQVTALAVGIAVLRPL